MAENTTIEWADHTFNPWIGCAAVSPDGCKNCYAADWAKRYGRDFAQRTRTSEANWKLPLKWNAQAEREGRRFRVFCASLADVFDNEVPSEWRSHLFCLIAATPYLDWLLLTKRIGNARPMIAEASATVEHYNPGIKPWTTAAPWPNVWIGATVVNQAEADRDIPKLLAAPARVRFLSMEPLMGPVDLRFHLFSEPTGNWRTHGGKRQMELRKPADGGIHWIIVGGESGPGARPMHPSWARALRDQCAAASVAFHFKQWGEWIEQDTGLADPLIAREGDPEFEAEMAKHDGFLSLDGHFVTDPDAMVDGVRYRGLNRVGKKRAGRLLDGRTHDGFPGGAA